MASEAGSKDPPKPIEYWLNGFREWKMYFVTNDENSPIELKTAPILEKVLFFINNITFVCEIISSDINIFLGTF